YQGGILELQRLFSFPSPCSLAEHSRLASCPEYLTPTAHTVLVAGLPIDLEVPPGGSQLQVVNRIRITIERQGYAHRNRYHAGLEGRVSGDHPLGEELIEVAEVLLEAHQGPCIGGGDFIKEHAPRLSRHVQRRSVDGADVMDGHAPSAAGQFDGLAGVDIGIGDGDGADEEPAIV